MAAYLIAFAKVKDPKKREEYSAAAGPTLLAAGATVVSRGKVVGTLVGQLDAETCFIAKFPSVEAARRWYDSPEYQALLPVREQGMTPTFVLSEDAS